MEAKRTIRSYIGLGRALPLALAAALLLCVLFLVLALRPPGPQTPSEAALTAFDSRGGESGSEVYIDLLGLSEGLVRSENDGAAFYVAEKADNEYCIVYLTDGQLGLLGAQREHWDGVSSISLPYRLSGYCGEIPETAKSTIAGIFEMSDELFAANFGTRCFFGALPQKGPAPVRGGLLALAALFALVFLALLALLALRLSAAASALLRLEEADALEAAADEIDADETELLAGDRLRLGKRFLFGWHNALAAEWKDLLWCYDRPLLSDSLALCRALVLCTADGKKHALLFPAGAKKELRLLTERLAQANPQLLRGESAENRAAYAERLR